MSLLNNVPATYRKIQILMGYVMRRSAVNAGITEIFCRMYLNTRFYVEKHGLLEKR